MFKHRPDLLYVLVNNKHILIHIDFPFCKNAEESANFQLYFTKQWQDTFQLSLRNFLTTIYQCLPQPTFVRAEQEANHIRRLQEENALLKSRLTQIMEQQQLNNSASGSQLNATNTDARRYKTLSDILPFDVNPSGPVADDFCIIATEVNSTSQASDAQAKGLKMLIKNIGSSGSPVMGRKDASIGSGTGDKSNKRRSGSVGRNWI